MTIQFNDETFRDDYSFHNSQRAIDRFPFPFHEDPGHVEEAVPAD